VRVFCLHDCDAAGTIIWQSLQEATRARPERSIKIINLGLDVDEAIGLAADGVITEIEDIEPDGDLPVADYAEEHADWFQHHRVELNAFTTLDFIRWLDTKMAEHGGEKVIPPGDVLSESYEEKLRSNLTEKITEQILAEADLDGQVEAALQAHAKKRPATVKRLHGKVKRSLVEDPQQPWDAIIAAMAVADATEGGQS